MVETDYFIHKTAAATQAIARARTVFVISNIAAIIVVAANFNLYGSWLRHMIERHPRPEYCEVLKAIAAARVEDTTIISVPLIGLKFFAGDISVLAAVAMLVVAAWFYYSLRRTRHTVAKMVIEVIDPQARSFDAWHVPPDMLEKAQYLLYSLSSAFVFTQTSYEHDAFIDPAVGIDDEPPQARWIASILIWAPCWTVVGSFLIDWISLLFDSVLLPQSKTMKRVLSTSEEVDIFLRSIFIIAAIVVIGKLCRHASRDWNWTSAIYDALVRAVHRSEAEPRPA